MPFVGAIRIFDVYLNPGASAVSFLPVGRESMLFRLPGSGPSGLSLNGTVQHRFEQHLVFGKQLQCPHETAGIAVRSQEKDSFCKVWRIREQRGCGDVQRRGECFESGDCHEGTALLIAADAGGTRLLRQADGLAQSALTQAAHLPHLGQARGKHFDKRRALGHRATLCDDGRKA